LGKLPVGGDRSEKFSKRISSFCAGTVSEDFRHGDFHSAFVLPSRASLTSFSARSMLAMRAHSLVSRLLSAGR
jgi:hypothetical protein